MTTKTPTGKPAEQLLAERYGGRGFSWVRHVDQLLDAVVEQLEQRRRCDDLAAELAAFDAYPRSHHSPPGKAVQ